MIEAMQNTNILLDVEEYHSPIFEKEIKMPSLYPNNTQEEKNKIFIDLVWSEWEKEKHNVPENNWKHYKQEIQKEIDIVITTKHADYFLLNREIILKGKSLGGVISYSGRGSAVSFYINKLLGFTQVDRISAKVSMYPERFMSPTRILESKTLADFDMNLANPEIFALAQKQILGEESSYPLIAFGTMRPKAAFKMYARAKQMDFESANLISMKIDTYEQDFKHTSEEERETLNVLDYIEPEFRETFLGSQKYLGIVADIKVAPCGYLLYSGNIRKEIGLIRINSANGNQHICTVMDGLWAENYKFLKNDLLKVSVVELIDAIYRRINIPQDTVGDLLKKTEGNEKVWEIYKNAWTKGINQIEQHGTSGRAVKYKPKNVVELCAFIAAVRPGFASMYKIFESREEFCYDIPSFDRLIQTPEMPQSFVLYQEQSMATLNYAGIPMAECYEILKNIAKKRADKVLKYKEAFLRGFSNKIKRDENKTIDEAKKLSEQVWKILEDSSSYSFNASHSYCVAIDSLYGAYLKAYYPIYFYEVFLNILEKNGEKDRMSATKIEAEKSIQNKISPL
jgi:DNA polymerase III alpha subunit